MRLRRSRPPTPAYARFLSSLFAGLLFFVTGVIGFRVGVRGALLGDGRWAGGPILEQVGLGLAFLALAVFFFRRLPGPATPPAPSRLVRSVGGGKSAGAQQRRLIR
jgi:hypothetical protein